MTDLLSSVDAPSDAELISRVRGGDGTAYGELFARHVDAARRLSRQLVRGGDADDLVSEAFAKVLQVLQGGGGPDVAFRAYLLTAVRRLHVDRVRAGSRLQSSDDMSQFDPGIPFQDTAVASFESGAAARAFASLPERWQLVLWHLEVEGQKPADIAPLLGMSANSVSALAYRAREGLRQAFLTMHLNDTSAERCRWVNSQLGGYVRHGLSKRDTAKVDDHLRECRRCAAVYLELTEVNSDLRGIIAPLLLGAAAAGYVSSGGAAGGAGLAGVVGRVRDVVAANSGAATAGAVAAGVAVVAAAGVVIVNAGARDVSNDAGRPPAVARAGAPGAGRTGSPLAPAATAATTQVHPTAGLPSATPTGTSYAVRQRTLAATGAVTAVPVAQVSPAGGSDVPTSPGRPAAAPQTTTPTGAAAHGSGSGQQQPSQQPTQQPSQQPGQQAAPFTASVSADGRVLTLTVPQAPASGALLVGLASRQGTGLAASLLPPGCTLTTPGEAVCVLGPPPVQGRTAMIRVASTATDAQTKSWTTDLSLAFSEPTTSDLLTVSARLVPGADLGSAQVRLTVADACTRVEDPCYPTAQAPGTTPDPTGGQTTGTGTPGSGDVSTPPSGDGTGTTDPTTPPTDPGATQPGTTDPGTTDPGATDPGAADPGTTDPGQSAGPATPTVLTGIVAAVDPRTGLLHVAVPGVPEGATLQLALQGVNGASVSFSDQQVSCAYVSDVSVTCSVTASPFTADVPVRLPKGQLPRVTLAVTAVDGTGATVAQGSALLEQA